VQTRVKPKAKVKPVCLLGIFRCQCTPHRVLPTQPQGQMDGCTVALPPRVEVATEDFHLPPLECEIRLADQKSDVSNKLLNSLKRSGWVIKVSIRTP